MPSCFTDLLSATHSTSRTIAAPCSLLFVSPPPATTPFFPYTPLFRPRAAGVLGRNGYQQPSPRHNALYSNWRRNSNRSEEHTSELQSPDHLVCRLLLEKKKRPDQQTPKTDIPTTRNMLIDAIRCSTQR